MLGAPLPVRAEQVRAAGGDVAVVATSVEAPAVRVDGGGGARSGGEAVEEEDTGGAVQRRHLFTPVAANQVWSGTVTVTL